MCNYSQMILDNGIEKGRAEGILEPYIKMYTSSVIPLDVAAREYGVSKEAFLELVNEAKNKNQH